MTTLVDDPLVELMKAADVPVTRENYIDLAWGVERPEPWTYEDEDMLPEELQKGRDSSGAVHDSPCSCARCSRHD